MGNDRDRDRAHNLESYVRDLQRPAVVSNKTFQIIVFNPLFSKAFGRPAPGKEYLVDFVAPSDKNLLLDSYGKWAEPESNQLLPIKCHMRLPQGITALCELNIEPVPVPSKEEDFFIIVIKLDEGMKGTRQADYQDDMHEKIYFNIQKNGQISALSQAAQSSIGRESLNEIIGSNLFDLSKLPYNRFDESRLWQTLIENDGQVENYEIVLPKADGTKVVFDSLARFYFNDQVQIEGVEGFAIDVTNQKELITKLQNALDFTHSLLQALPTPLMYKNKNLVFEGCNQAFTQLTGVSMQELKGKKAGDIWDNKFSTTSETKEKEALETGREQIFEGYISNVKGERIPVIMVTACHPGPKGMVGVVSSFLDITARKAIELAIKRNEEAIYKENISLKRIINPHLRKTVMVGASQAVMALYDQIYQAAKTNLPVLIEGESGTGKELVAKEIHRGSDRSGRNVVTVNCSAVPRELTESMFFGHIKGAFTGALNENKGYIRSAHDSTLFLDEVNSIPLDKQAKLLRVLESGEVAPVGGSVPEFSNFRLISASNQGLKALVDKGRMRADFYYRLTVLKIKVPPLRERKEDIPLLTYHFLNQFKQEHPDGYNSEKKFITRELFGKLNGYDFPGNIRELRNVLFQYFATGHLSLSPPREKETPDPQTPDQPATTLARESDFSLPPDGSLKEVMSAVEKKLILQLLERYRYNRTKVAKHLQIGRKTLYNKMKAHGIDTED